MFLRFTVHSNARTPLSYGPHDAPRPIHRFRFKRCAPDSIIGWTEKVLLANLCPDERGASSRI